MMAAPDIAALIPHGGAMVLLDAIERWDDSVIACRARSHLAPANPLRRAGRLRAVAGIEYGLQAMALHGALTSGAAQPAGRLASLRGVAISVEWLDDPALGVLRVGACREWQEAGGLIYRFDIAAEDGRSLLSGQAVIALPRPA
jgi:predicted hotdog family 3-hydroxylacyl-ACP dehydratase